MNLYLKWRKDKEVKQITEIELTVSFDMTWQKGDSGNRYDSIFGHVIMIEVQTEKVIGILVYGMKCSKCAAALKTSDQYKNMTVH